MELSKEIRKRYDELAKIKEETDKEFSALTAYLTKAGLLDEEKPKRTRRKKDAPIQPEDKKGA